MRWTDEEFAFFQAVEWIMVEVTTEDLAEEIADVKIMMGQAPLGVTCARQKKMYWTNAAI